MSDNLRKFHLVLGLFFAPSILFFALTGTLQTFQLHEAHGDYTPPAIVSASAGVHKDQVLDTSLFEAPAPDAPPPRKHPAQELVPFKWFVLFMSIGLMASQLTGILLALRFKRDRVLMLGALGLGSIMPVALLLFH